MPYTRSALQNLLPNPGFSKESNLIGRESNSFGPKVAQSLAFTTVAGVLSGDYRKQTDDLTFIIPFSSDPSRMEGFYATITWIIATTSAKIILCSAENEESYKEFANHDKFDPNLRLTWDQYSDPNFDPVQKQAYIRMELHLAMCDRFCVAYALMKDFKVNILNDEGLQSQFADRVSVIVDPRKKDEPFHRTRYLNMMLDKVTTKFVCNHDADTILSSAGLMTSLVYLRKNAAHVVYPYQRGIKAQKRVFFKQFTAPNSLNTLALTGDMSEILHEQIGILEWPASYGQSILFNTEVYKKMGGENENFISWGAEDIERYTRAIKMRYVVARVPSPIVHIEHGRGPDSSVANPKWQENENLWNAINSMDGEQLKKYYAEVDYRKKYKW